MKLKYYLISFAVQGGWAHGYLMTDEPRFTTAAAAKMMEKVEAAGGRIGLPAVCVTELTSQRDIVETIFRENHPEAAKLMDVASSFHFSFMTMKPTDPGCDTLLKVH